MGIVVRYVSVTCCATGDLAHCFDSMSYTQTDYKTEIKNYKKGRELLKTNKSSENHYIISNKESIYLLPFQNQIYKTLYIISPKMHASTNLKPFVFLFAVFLLVFVLADSRVE